MNYIDCPNPTLGKQLTTLTLDTEAYGEDFDFETGDVHSFYEVDKAVQLSNGQHRITLRMDY